MRFCVFSDLHYDAVPDGARRLEELLRDHVKFVFLDANYLKTADGYLPERRENYAKATVVGPYIPPEQLAWLEREIVDDRYFYVICTHQSLANDFVTKTKARGIVNRQEVRAILERRNARSHRVLFCINGHEHGSDIKKIGSIHYYTHNSTSYFWQSVKEMYPYSRETHERYPYLKNMVLYREPLHSIVTIDESGAVTIAGMEGHYLTVGPQDIGMGDTWNGVSILPRTESLTI